MLSIDQLVIVAYFTDGGVLCHDCGEDAGLPTSEAVCAYSASEFAGNEGLYCDDCSEEIVAPYEWECPYCDTSYVGAEAADAENANYGNSKCCDDCPGDPDEEEEEE